MNNRLMAPIIFGAMSLFALVNQPAHALEFQTLFNFQIPPGTVTGNLVQGPDGNFYGTSAQGGPTGNGAVFRVTPQGVLTSLVPNPTTPAADLVVGNDGLIYGMTSAGGAFGAGTVFKMTTGGVLTNFAVFNSVNAGNPQAGPVLAGDGNFYGASPRGGTNSQGAVFRVTPAGVVTTLASFNSSQNIGVPSSGLTLGPDGNLYGITSSGIFKITTAGALTLLYSFNLNADGFVRQTRLTAGPDGNLYGTSRDGGTSDSGTIFRITTNGIFTNLVSFAFTNGMVPLGQLTVGPDGQLYGTTQLGGSGFSGTIFKVTTNGALTTLYSFPGSGNGSSGVPQAGLLFASDGNFYGCTPGEVFRMTPAGSVSTLVSLLPITGLHPHAGLLLGPDGNFYGTTHDGGTNNLGTIFRMTPGGALTSLFSFAGTNGSTPQAGLATGLDGNFYGTTTTGGTNIGANGTVFRFLTNGTLTTMASFKGGDGNSPQCELVTDASGNFYGTTSDEGPAGSGTIFRMTTNGVLTAITTFATTSGTFPQDGLTASQDGNFYGTTASGGTNGLGTVFRVTPDGVLKSLFAFGRTNGANPLGTLVQSPDGTLYGTTASGGTNPNLSFGTIFKITTNGLLTTLYNFDSTNGSLAANKMIFGPDGALYGTANSGGFAVGGNGQGTVFRITTNGVFTPVIRFQGTNGANPDAPLVFGNDGNLYGTTADGGPGGGGTIFRIILAPKFTGIARAANGNISLSGTGSFGGAYRIWTSTNLMTPIAAWTLLTNGVFDANAAFSLTNVTTASGQFYRISVP